VAWAFFCLQPRFVATELAREKRNGPARFRVQPVLTPTENNQRQGNHVFANPSSFQQHAALSGSVCNTLSAGGLFV
jgi:hypothetical protein